MPRILRQALAGPLTLFSGAALLSGCAALFRGRAAPAVLRAGGGARLCLGHGVQAQHLLHLIEVRPPAGAEGTQGVSEAKADRRIR